MDSWDFRPQRDALTGRALFANMGDDVFKMLYTVGALLATYIGIQYYRGIPPSRMFSAAFTLFLESLSHVLPYRLQELVMRATKRVRLSVEYSTNFMMGAKAQYDDAPCGLGNFDNSCYQNAILQCLAAMPAVREYLYSMSDEFDFTGEDSLNGTLATLVQTLNDPAHNGTHKWTPRRLKTMDSHLPQDAHEYFSMMLDLGEKEIVQALKVRLAQEKMSDATRTEQGPKSDELENSKEEAIVEIADKSGRPKDARYQNPLDGILGERTVCDQCGFSEGIRLVDFNCLMTQFPRLMMYGSYCDISQLLDEFTKCETVGPTYCPNCTVLKARDVLKEILSKPEMPEARTEVLRTRLEGVEELVESKEFGLDEVNLIKKGIAKKSWVSTTKTKQCVIAKAPRCLAVNIERNVFDEMTGNLRKNTTVVKLPSEINLSPWILGGSGLPADQDPKEAAKVCPVPPQSRMCRGSYDESTDDTDRPQVYRLRALVKHLGFGVDDGHYICNKLHPIPPRELESQDEDDIEADQQAETDAQPVEQVEEQTEEPQEQWWEISDETVRPSNEDFVTQSAHGAFMLFYEKVESTEEPARADTPVAPEVIEGELVGLGVENDETAEDASEGTLLADSEQPAATNGTAEAGTEAPHAQTASVEISGTAIDSDADTDSSHHSDAESTDQTVQDAPASARHSPIIMRTAGASTVRADVGNFNAVHRPSSLSHYS